MPCNFQPFKNTKTIIKKKKLPPKMMKNVIGYFSITTKPKVMIFDDESIKIRFVSPWSLL